MGVLKDQRALAPQVDHALRFTFVFWCFCDNVSPLYRHGCAGTCYVDRAGPDLIEVNLPLLPKL